MTLTPQAPARTEGNRILLDCGVFQRLKVFREKN